MMFPSNPSNLLAATTFAALLAAQGVMSAAYAQDPPPPPPVPADEVAPPSAEHHYLNKSPVTNWKHVDAADIEARTRRARGSRMAYGYRPYYYYYYIPNTNPGMTTGANMYFPDPGSYAYGYTADGVGYGF